MTTETHAITLLSLLNQPVREMTLDEAKLFVLLCQVKNNPGVPKHMTLVDATRFGRFGELVFRRMEAHSLNTRITFALSIWIHEMCKGIPGRNTLWCWTLHQMLKENKANTVPMTLLNWAQKFPMGIPTDEAYNTVWAAQKKVIEGVGSINLLDSLETWQ